MKGKPWDGRRRRKRRRRRRRKDGTKGPRHYMTKRGRTLHEDCQALSDMRM